MIELRLCLRISPPRSKPSLAAFLTLARLAQLERGCLEARLFTESHNGENVCYIEAWDTEENLCAMLRSEHFTRLVELMEMAIEPPRLVFLTITAIRGLEFVWQVRHDHDEPQPGELNQSELIGRQRTPPHDG
jgi:quinol monooxygenase YgiN